MAPSYADANANDPGCGYAEDACLGDGEALVGLSAKDVGKLGDAEPASVMDATAGKKDAKAGDKSAEEAVSYEYSSVVQCTGNTPDDPRRNFCAHAITFCEQQVPDSSGPAVDIWRRETFAKGSPGPWQQIGWTCYANAVPGVKPLLTTAMIHDAWRHTAFAKPAVQIEPQGNTTLVRLPTYFAVTWPAQGFQPGEIDIPDKAAMLGHTVRIRPTLVGYHYDFGDGTHTGGTTSPGGPYPTGDITKVYPRAGAYTTGITSTYGGEFSIDGGDWIPIPDTLTIAGPTAQLQVKTAKNQLVQH